LTASLLALQLLLVGLIFSHVGFVAPSNLFLQQIFHFPSGVAGADFDPNVAVVLGFANLIGDALSMGVGDYLSERAEIDFAINEKRREEWEVENYIEGEKKEMVELYVGKGMSEDDATTVIDVMAKYPKIFVDTMYGHVMLLFLQLTLSCTK
jgi:hypothetical protein